MYGLWAATTNTASNTPSAAIDDEQPGHQRAVGEAAADHVAQRPCPRPKIIRATGTSDCGSPATSVSVVLMYV